MGNHETQSYRDCGECQPAAIYIVYQAAVDLRLFLLKGVCVNEKKKSAIRIYYFYFMSDYFC